MHKDQLSGMPLVSHQVNSPPGGAAASQPLTPTELQPQPTEAVPLPSTHTTQATATEPATSQTLSAADKMEKCVQQFVNT